MAKPDEPRRRFAPVPIETTFQFSRKTSAHGQARLGPNPELTPDPSPRSSPPPVRHHLHELHGRRRFHPQLIETSRRVRRVGDAGPATKPTDKTDITPYTNHIYTARPKKGRRHGQHVEDDGERPMPPTRRETEEEGVKEYLLELAAKDAARQLEEAALAAFPNSRAREGGVAHFYFRDSSDSDESPNGTPLDQQHGHVSKSRRKSSSLDLNWWHRHMQDHAEHIASEQKWSNDAMDIDNDVIIRSDSDLDKMELPGPPDAIWTTNTSVAPDDRRDSMTDLRGPKGERAPCRSPALSSSVEPSQIAIGEPSHLADRGPVKPDIPAAQLPAGVVKQERSPCGPFGRPFAAFGLEPEDPKVTRMRQMASPPMLGKDLTFRKCPSPKQTKLDTDHSFAQRGIEEHNRDMTGGGGLWNGYCCKTEATDCYIVPTDTRGPGMMVTPYPPSSPQDDADSPALSEEPVSLLSASDSSETTASTVEHRCKPAKSKGLHMLHGLDDRLRQEKAQADFDERIAQEFNDEFVTQVYNYLSLGYPAMARAYDQELAKISLLPTDELSKHDSNTLAKGHMLEMKLEETGEGDRCPRWEALRRYITEWAKQQPDLDNLDPLAWGVRGRRGSWAI